MTNNLIHAITSHYLYGTPNPPSIKLDADLIRDENIESTFQIPVTEFMEDGAGRFATPYEFEIVREFFDDSNNIAAGNYTLSGIRSQLSLSTDHMMVNINQKEYGDFNADYLERVYRIFRV